MTAPKRIQLRRTPGWRKPEGAISVARPTKWGNPFRVGSCARVACGPHLPPTHWHVYEPGRALSFLPRTHLDAVDRAVKLFRQAAMVGALDVTTVEIRAELAGHDLACWCPADQPCHADVLLELANGGGS